MARKRINYSEGTVFVLPLRDGGFARGVIARMDGRGSVLGYFFGPRLSSSGDDCGGAGLTPDAAVYCCIFGDLGLLNGEWSILGDIQDWVRDDWPVPSFVYRDDGTGKCYLRHYDEDNLSFLREEEADEDATQQYPRDGCAGYGAVEIRLTDMLGGNEGAARF